MISSVLVVTADIFYNPGEQSTRFLNRTMNFKDAFRFTSTGPQGTAPDLWNCNYGTGGVSNSSGCFRHHSTASLSNYTSIPSGWR
jgi:hypothetical protein